MPVTMANHTTEDRDNKRRKTLMYLEGKVKTHNCYQLCGRTKPTMTGFLSFGGHNRYVILRKIMGKSFEC